MDFKKLTILDLEMVKNMTIDFDNDIIIKEENANIFLKNNMNWIFSCIENNKIIGYAYGYELNRLDRNENMLYLHAVGIMPEYQRKGIGTKMMNELKELCKKNKIYKMFLFTQKTNIGACKLYEKIGGELSFDSKDGKIKDNDRTYFFNIN